MISLIKKRVKIFCFVLVLTLFISMAVSAGGNNPLFLESSSPSDGDKNISTELGEIKLVFSKNIVNMKVKDGNLKCFKLYDENNNELSIDVLMADDQIDREKRHDIILKLNDKLLEGATYTIRVSENLQAKNGITLEKPLEIEFKTEGGSNNSVLIITILVVVLAIVVFYFNKRKK